MSALCTPACYNCQSLLIPVLAPNISVGTDASVRGLGEAPTLVFALTRPALVSALLVKLNWLLLDIMHVPVPPGDAVLHDVLVVRDNLVAPSTGPLRSV